MGGRWWVVAKTDEDVDEAVTEYAAKLEYSAGFSRQHANRLATLYGRLVREVDACAECRHPYRLCDEHRALRATVEDSLDWRQYENRLVKL